MRSTIYEPSPSDVDNQDLLLSAVALVEKWIPFGLLLLAPFVVGLLVGVAFAWFIKRRGWRARVISTWPISVMFGSLAYVAAAAILCIERTHFGPGEIIAGLGASIFLTWPIWLVIGPIFFVYVAYLRKRQKWLRDSTVVYLSAFALTSEYAFIVWLSR